MLNSSLYLDKSAKTPLDIVFKASGKSSLGDPYDGIDVYKRQVLVSDGDVVKAGDALFQIDMSGYNIQITQLRT